MNYFECIGSYLVEVEHMGQKRYYDAEKGKLGCYINQRGVFEALNEIRKVSSKQEFPNFNEADWKTINDKLEQLANVKYRIKRSSNRLVVVSSSTFLPSLSATELFAWYGDIRSYWISGIIREPEEYPKPYAQIVRFLYNSSQSNWTKKQKAQWGDCEDIIDENGNLPHLEC